MIDLALQPVANQELVAQLDGSRYELVVKEANGVMCATVTRDGVVLVQGARLVALEPVLPYAYQQRGNFVLLTEDEDLPYFTRFATTQSLVYVSPEEIAELRGA